MYIMYFLHSNFDLYFHNADIVILVGDVSKPASFKDLEDNVVPYLKKYCNRHYQGMLPVMVVMGNKHDLQLDGHVPMVLTEELCEVMTDSYNANFGVLCSARVDIDIDNAFDKAINIAVCITHSDIFIVNCVVPYHMFISLVLTS